MIKTGLAMLKDRRYNPRLILGLLWLYVRRGLGIGFTISDDAHEESAKETVDIVIPTIAKDEALLESVVDSLSLLGSSIGKIFIISQPLPRLEALCARRGWTFVDESRLMPGIRESIRYAISGKDMNGWLFQQFLKLKAADIVSTKRYFVIDSDTVLVRPHAFMRGGKTTLFESTEWHGEYFKAYQSIFGRHPRRITSSVCHMMLFDAARVKEMLAEIEMLRKAPWPTAILGAIDLSKTSCFSEFETYANWMKDRHPEDIRFSPFYNKSLNRGQERPPSEGRVNSISFHSY